MSLSIFEFYFLLISCIPSLVPFFFHQKKKEGNTCEVVVLCCVCICVFPLPLDARGPEEYKVYTAVWSSSSSCAQCSFLPDSFIRLLLKNRSEAASPAAAVTCEAAARSLRTFSAHKTGAGGDLKSHQTLEE